MYKYPIHNIRAVRDSDVTALLAFMAHWGPEPNEMSPEDILFQICHCRQHVSGELFVALDKQGQMIAYLQMTQVSLVGFLPAAEVAALLVHSDLRSRGIGTQLIEFAQKWCTQNGLNRLLVSSQLHRTEAHRFYKRCGFTLWKQSAVFEITVPLSSGGLSQQHEQVDNCKRQKE
ncbi:MAG: GNAT family N-acetyltransferase [Deltaproteobacteria bacterium]|nr:GNAT family N-acetyltransferase [Deltaproteobacteria bacterium]